jgi:hypothetical protein
MEEQGTINAKLEMTTEVEKGLVGVAAANEEPRPRRIAIWITMIFKVCP